VSRVREPRTARSASNGCLDWSSASYLAGNQPAAVSVWAVTRVAVIVVPEIAPWTLTCEPMWNWSRVAGCVREPNVVCAVSTTVPTVPVVRRNVQVSPCCAVIWPVTLWLRATPWCCCAP